MPVDVYCMWVYIFSFTTVISSQKDTPVSVNVLENGSAILFYPHNNPVKGFQIIWNEGSKIIGIITYNEGSSPCNVTHANPDDCFCNSTHASLEVKHVGRDKHGKRYTSGDLYLKRTFVYTLYVTVLVESVQITNVNQSTVIIAENKEMTLECKTSPSRPSATIKWENNSSPLNSGTLDGSINDEDGLVIANSTVSLKTDKKMNGNNVTCSGSNYPNNLKYDWVILNITYPPAQPPTIDNLYQHAKFAIIENKDGFLNCTIGESNPPTLLGWTCNGSDYHNESNMNNTSKRLQVRASRYTQPLCRCFSTYVMGSASSSNQTEVILDVLYPATINAVILNGINISEQQLDVIENDTVQVSCNAEGNPHPNVTWDLQNNSIDIITLSNLTRNNTTSRYNCTATNFMKDSNGREDYGNDSKGFFVNVLYPPALEPLSMSKVIEGEYFIKTCRTSSGKTSNQTVIWTSGNATAGVNSTYLIFPKVTRNQAANYMCKVIYEVVPTYGGNRSGHINSSFYLDVLYKPENVALTISTGTEQQFNITNNFSIIENTSVVFYCSASGNPKPKQFSWPRFEIHASNSEQLQFIATRQSAGPITCHANNIMGLTNGTNITGDGSVTYDMNILYPPTINITHDGSIHEGGNITIKCMSTSGNTTSSTTFWILANGRRVQGSSFTINNLTKNDTGNYTCEIYYSMYPTYGEWVNDSLHQAFTLEFQVSNPINIGNDDEQRTSVGPAIGGSIGGVIAVLIIVSSVFFIKRRMDKRPKVGKQHPEYQNMNFIEENKHKKRLPPIPPEDVHAVSDKQHQVHHVGDSDDHAHPNTGELEMQSKPKEVKHNPEYQNMNLMEDVNQHTHLHWVPTENGRQEHLNHKVNISEEHQNSATRKMQQRPKEVNQHSEYVNMNLTEAAKHHKRLPPIPTEDVYEVPDQQHQVHHVDDSEDQNPMEILDIINTISISDLLSYVTCKTTEDYIQEYGRFTPGMMATIPYSFARKPQNAPLNRYQGIYPYDHSRVVIPAEPDFFINANYIDGHTKKKAYIASLGPTVRHTLGFQTFWKMVWHETSDVIVMLTNLQEPSGMKCEKYWADNGTTREVGDFTIHSVSEDVAAEYIVRTFNVSKKGESRLVTQLHYTAWPDKKVPEDVTSLIEFWQRVKAAPTRSLGPLVVHCSAGIGRTGTYIALDLLYEEGKSTNTVNVFDCVMNMRKQRVNMVQTQDQYVYLHQALVYCLVFNIEPITADKIEEYVKTTSHNVYSKLLQQLKQSVEVESTYETEARTRNCDVPERNRQKADIPGDAHRIRLFLDKESDESDYINAVYLNGFKRLGHFIIAQSPLPNTLDDFVSMMYQENCCCVVSLDDYQQKGTNNAEYLPQENQQVTYGNCTITSTMLDDTKSTYFVRKLKIGHSGKFEKGVKIAHHFEFTGWKHDEKIPKDVNMFVEFVKDVEEYATQLADEHSHVLVHCMTGSGRSGLFCAVTNLIQKMGQERQVSVVNTLRQVRTRRKTAIPNMEQIKFCYQSVFAFVKNYKI